MQENKIYIVATGLDESIKRFTPSYDITIFPDFVSLESHVNTTPDIISSLIVAENTLQFNGANMDRLLKCVDNPFITITNRVIYLIHETTDKKAVDNFILMTDRKILTCYQGTLTEQFIIGIINGKLRDDDEEETEEVIYRYRAKEYAQDQKIQRYMSSNDEHYESDDEQLAGIPDVEEPIIFRPQTESHLTEYKVVGKPGFARTIFAFLEAQYLALGGKTLIIESDVQFHRLTDIALKTDIKYLYLDISDVLQNIQDALEQIYRTQEKLIVIGSKHNTQYNYNFIVDLLEDVLGNNISNIVVECSYDMAPYKMNYTIVCDCTMPDVLECCQSLLYNIEKEHVAVVGIKQSRWQEYNLTSQELSDVFSTVLDIDGVFAQTVTVEGSKLKQEVALYDLLSVIGRGNRR